MSDYRINDYHIKKLIAARAAITTMRDFDGMTAALDGIDAALSTVPPGMHNDVDLLLGRACAQLPKRVVMVQHANGAIETANDWAELTTTRSR